MSAIQHRNPGARRSALGELAWLFLKLGATAFGLGLLVGAKTRSLSASTDMGAHTLAAPAWAVAPPRQVARARSPASRGIGSQLQTLSPVCAEKARTTPRGARTRWLSVIADPTTTRSPITAGGEVTPSHSSGWAPMRRP